MSYDDDDDELGPSPPVFPPFPPVPTDPHDPAVSFIHDPEPPGLPLNSEAYVYGLYSYHPAQSYHLFSGSSFPYSMPGTSQQHQLSFFPYLPAYVAGESEDYFQNVEHGNSETEQQSFISYGPSLLVYQPGEFSHYESTVGHGNEERETKGHLLLHHYYPSPEFWEISGFPRVASMQLSPSVLANRDQYVSPPWWWSHPHSEMGGSYSDKLGYKSFYYPKAQC